MFKVGDWATTNGHKGLIQIMKLVGEKAIVETFRSNGQPLGITGKLLSELEHATPEEIAAGHRIDCQILDHPEDYTSPNCKKYKERVGNNEQI